MVYFNRDNNFFAIPFLGNVSENKWSQGSTYHEIRISFSISFQFFLLQKEMVCGRKKWFLAALIIVYQLEPIRSHVSCGKCQ